MSPLFTVDFLSTHLTSDMGKIVIPGNASGRPYSGRISNDEGGDDSLLRILCTTSCYFFCQKSINNNLNLKGGDTAGLSLLYTVTGQLKKLKKLARLLSIKGEASQEYRSGCWIT